MAKSRVGASGTKQNGKTSVRPESRKSAAAATWPASRRQVSKPLSNAADLLAVLPVAPEAALKQFLELGLINKSDSARLLRRWSVFESALELFAGNFAEARRWLQSPARALGGRMPLEVAGTAAGATQVRDLIGQLEHGVFA